MRQSISIDILPVVAVVAIVVILSSSVCALEITECNGVQADTFINNTRPNCNHILIFCDGSNSQFCDSTDSCDLNYNCAETNNPGSSSSTVSDSSSSTASNTTVTESTPTTSSSTTDVRALCRHGVTKKYRYPNNCNYYYYCVDGFLVVEQCPIGWAFNEQNSTCSGHSADIVDCRRR